MHYGNALWLAQASLVKGRPKSFRDRPVALKI